MSEDYEVHRKKTRIVLKIIMKFAFFVYIFFLFYMLFWSNIFNREQGYDFYRYNLSPFNEILRFLKGRNVLDLDVIMVNVFGNILAFIPLGAAMNWMVKIRLRWFHVLLYIFFVSLVVESLQLLFKVGVFDVDDLILNTFGGLIGFWIYYICDVVYKKRQGIK